LWHVIISQYLGVNRVIGKLQSEEPVNEVEVEAGRLGVFWHTQGSGMRKALPKAKFIGFTGIPLIDNEEKQVTRRVFGDYIWIDLHERYQEIVAEYNRDKDAVEVQKVFDDLFKFHDGLDDEQRRYLREELDNEDQLAVFDLLKKDNLTRPEREQIKVVAKELLKKLLADKLKIDHWREKATAQAQVRAEIIKHLFVNLPGTGYAEHEISSRADLVFAHLYQTGIGVGAGSQMYH